MLKQVSNVTAYPKVGNFQSTFKKSMEEKELLRGFKMTNRLERQKAFGNDYKRHLNIKEKSFGSTKVQF